MTSTALIEDSLGARSGAADAHSGGVQLASGRRRVRRKGKHAAGPETKAPRLRRRTPRVPASEASPPTERGSISYALHAAVAIQLRDSTPNAGALSRGAGDLLMLVSGANDADPLWQAGPGQRWGWRRARRRAARDYRDHRPQDSGIHPVSYWEHGSD